MECLICKKGETTEGKATLVLERGMTTLVIKGVPALVCNNCGEEYVDEAAGREVLNIAEQAARSGVQVEIRDYEAA